MGHTRPFRLAHALREAFAEGYGPAKLRADVLAGLVVGIVALPLSMALAIASGAPPQHGLYTAIVAGATAALLGGSRVLVSGPTAAFVVILAPVAERFGLEGLVLASALAGLILVVMGLLRLGRLIQFVPYPVTTGFTAGIGLVIASLQLKDFLGLRPEALTGEAMWHERMLALGASLPTVSLPDVAVGTLTLAVLMLWRRLKTHVPAPLVALTIGAVAAWALERFAGLAPATLASRFGTPEHPAGIPGTPPVFVLPWHLPGPDGPSAALSLAYLESLLPSAFAIAMLGAIESLLAAVVADGMTGQKHQPDVELTALGLANLATSFFGGFAATGAIARTATNVRSGGRSPIAAVVHSLFVLGSVLALAPLLGHLPMASLAALLLIVAWNMSEVRHVLQVVRTAPASDVAVLGACFALTVVFDMTIAVTAGILLAALLFMRRMVEISGAELIGPTHPEHGKDLPPGVIVYDIGGPLFFGAAHKATSQLFALDRREVKLVLLDLEDVPAIDATGIVNLRSAIDRLKSGGIGVILVGVQRQPREALDRAGLGPEVVERQETFEEALVLARRRVAG
ncbi:MAG TPA: C4-dicarboxylic acid transporter DauA [Planctomycetota bacterium]